LSFGISSGDVTKAGSGIVDDDFIRIDGTTMEGRSASEVLTDIGGLGTTLNSAQIFVGNGSNVATGVAMSGDIAITNAGVTAIQAGAVDIAMINASGSAGATTFLRGDGSWQTAGASTTWTANHDFAGYYYDMTVQTKPANPSANAGRFYVKEIDSSNDGLFCLIRKNSTDFVEVQIV